jgi:GDP-4-dehydro-6-deoxy-D-mannose reductase
VIRNNSKVLRRNILVTGVNGFVGRHVATELKNQGFKVIGMGVQSVDTHSNSAVDKYFSCDITDKYELAKIANHLSQVDAVIHLAGIATTNNNPRASAALLDTNVKIHQYLYEALQGVASTARIVAVSSGLVYRTDQAMPLRESISSLLQDNDSVDAYIRSKLRVESIAKNFRNAGLDILIARPFNHTGPGQQPGFFVPDQLLKIQSAKNTNQPMVLANSFDFWRDFTDVRDIAKAYILLATTESMHLTSDTYNIATGTSLHGRDIFRVLASKMHYAAYTLTKDQGSVGMPKIRGDASLLTRDTGWKPQIDFETTIQDFVALL